MEALFLVWMLVAGMRDAMSEGSPDRAVVTDQATNAPDVMAADEGPINPPKP